MVLSPNLFLSIFHSLISLPLVYWYKGLATTLVSITPKPQGRSRSPDFGPHWATSSVFVPIRDQESPSAEPSESQSRPG